MARIFFVFIFATTIEMASAHHSNDYHFDRNVDVTIS